MRQRHSIDLLFSLSLCMVFVLCAFLVLLFQVNGYHTIVDKGERLEAIHTPLAYVKTQIRSFDEQGAISLFHEQGMEGIRIQDSENASVLYIYEQDKQLKELRTADTITPDFTVGTSMFEIEDFMVEQREHVLEVKVRDNNGQLQVLRIPQQCS